MKKKIDVYEHMGEILKGVKSGVLVTGKADDRVNSMTISWGMVGIEWAKPVFVTFIRESRFTRSLIEKNGEFTVNIPVDDSAKKILTFCGSKSGRDVDKAKELGLTYEEPETISVPGIKELPLDSGMQSSLQTDPGHQRNDQRRPGKILSTECRQHIYRLQQRYPCGILW